MEYVHSSTGLYPSPMARNAKSSQRTKTRNKFVFIGKFIAKAVLDNRMVDVPFSKPFYQWLLKEDTTLSTRDLLNIDPTIANTVSQLEGIVRKKRKLEEDDKVITCCSTTNSIAVNSNNRLQLESSLRSRTPSGSSRFGT